MKNISQIRLQENEFHDFIKMAVFKLFENKLNESNDYHRYYDYIEEYSPYKIFDMVMNGEDLWTPLINPSMYKKALDEFVKYGYINKFPTKYIYQWFGIIMKNTAILRSTTEIAGHSDYSPFDDFYDYFFNEDGVDNNGVSWEDFLQQHGLTEDDRYEGMTEYLDEVGFYDKMYLPDGSSAWSDFGIEPIEKLIAKYNDNLSAEEVLVLINKILDIYHMRGDLSSMFIEGGSKTLTKISNNESTSPRNINKILKESKERGLINEIASSKIYHFTSISNALRIAEEDTIYLQSSLAGSSDTSYTSKKLFYLSTTRTKFQSFGYSRKFSDNAVRIELDGNKINQVMTAKPYNYWGGGDLGKRQYLKNDGKGLTIQKQEHTSDEAEDRLYSSSSSIQGAHNFIKRIDVIITDLSEENRYNYLNTKDLLLSKYGRFVFVYDNLNDFNKQSKNIINDRITTDFDSFEFSGSNDQAVKVSIDAIRVVLAAILTGESDNAMKDSAQLLKKYNLESYIKKGIFKKQNEYFDYPYNDYSRLADKLSNTLVYLSRKPNRDNSMILQMLSDYFKENGLKTYKDFIKHKSMNTVIHDRYGLVTGYGERGYIDLNKKYNALLIRNVETYDYVIVTDPYQVKVRTINKDIDNVAYNFVTFTEEMMKSKDYNSYERYIKKIFSRNPSIGEIIDMYRKMGGDESVKRLLEFVLDTIVTEREINAYSLSDGMVMPQCIYNKKYNLSYFLKLFKK